MNIELPILPSYESCRDSTLHCHGGRPTAIEYFICDFEPENRGKEFREGLTAVLEEFRQILIIEVRADIRSNGDIDFPVQSEHVKPLNSANQESSSNYEEDINFGMDIHDHVDAQEDNHEQELDEIDIGERGDPGLGEYLDYRN